MWKIDDGECRNALVTMRHGSSHAAYGTSEKSVTIEGCTYSSSHTTTLRPMSPNVTRPVRPALTRPPNWVRRAGTERAASRTQSTHCTPTAAGRWHSGQTGRPQR